MASRYGYMEAERELRMVKHSTVRRERRRPASIIMLRPLVNHSCPAWTNALIKLDINEPFSIGKPPLEVVQSDRNTSNAPPHVALGALAANADGSALYQYFGEFSDTPAVNPTPNRLWRYSIPDRDWEVVNTTGDTIMRVAEGASASAANVGTDGEPVSYYFGGHEDA
jgi:hypothetical protein